MGYRNGAEADLFGDLMGMGDLPGNANPIAQLESYRTRFPGLLAATTLRGANITHFTTTANLTSQQFIYFDASGTRKGDQVLPLPQSELRSGPVDPVKESAPYIAPLPGDGLLPSQTSDQQSGPTTLQRWLPWALVGGAVVLGGGMILLSARRPVAANRRGRRRRRSRRA